MDHVTAGQMWDGNAESWSELSRAGYNVCRDRSINPCFFSMLPDVDGLTGIDIGCGDGDNTRLVAGRGARMTGLDISPRFVEIARRTEESSPLGIDYVCASAVKLPLPDDHFDFAVAFMSLMDVPEYDAALTEAYRVIKPGGFLQFSITHPCNDVPFRQKFRDEHGDVIGLSLGGYFDGSSESVLEWHFGAAPPEVSMRHAPFRQPQLHHTLSEWLNTLIAIGFRMEQVEEPHPCEEALVDHPEDRDEAVWPYFLIIRCRK